MVEPHVPESWRRFAVVLVRHAGDDTNVRAAYRACGADTLFEVGSLSKALTGLLVADAVDRGELDLSAPLGRYLPELGGAPIAASTVSALCAHTSGLPRLPRTWGMATRLVAAAVGRNPYAGMTAADVVRDAARSRLRPGFRYSNLGGALAGEVVARAAGADFTDLLAGRVFASLGMTSSKVGEDGDVPPGRGERGELMRPWPMDGYAPAGGVVSTPGDLARLLAAVLEDRVPGAAALRPPVGAAPLFWVLEPGRAWHNGETGGYSCHVEVDLEAARAVAVLADVAAAEQLGRIADAVLAPSSR